MKIHHLTMITMGIVGITAIVLSTARARDTSRAERALADDLADDIGAYLSTPMALRSCYRVNCDSATATNVLVPMDGGSTSNPIPASSIYIAPCTYDDDGGPGTCTGQADITVGASDITISTGIRVGAGGTGTALSIDAKGAYCMGYGADQQADVCVGRQ